MEMTKYSEVNDNKSTTCQTLQDETEVTLNFKAFITNNEFKIN